MEAAIIALISALLASGLTGWILLASQKRREQHELASQERREQHELQMWLQQERLKACADFLSSAELLHIRPKSSDAEKSAHLAAIAKLRLLTGEAVSHAALLVSHAAGRSDIDGYLEAVEYFNEAVRPSLALVTQRVTPEQKRLWKEAEARVFPHGTLDPG